MTLFAPILRFAVHPDYVDRAQDIIFPKRGTEESAGYDIFVLPPLGTTSDTMTFEAGQKYDIPTGISMSLNPGYVGVIVPRSSTMMSIYACGIIDSDYRGHLSIRMKVTETFTCPITKALVQLLVFACDTKIAELVSYSDLGETARGSNGFGSTDSFVKARPELVRVREESANSGNTNIFKPMGSSRKPSLPIGASGKPCQPLGSWGSTPGDAVGIPISWLRGNPTCPNPVKGHCYCRPYGAKAVSAPPPLDPCDGERDLSEVKTCDPREGPWYCGGADKDAAMAEDLDEYEDLNDEEGYESETEHVPWGNGEECEPEPSNAAEKVETMRKMLKKREDWVAYKAGIELSHEEARRAKKPLDYVPLELLMGQHPAWFTQEDLDDLIEEIQSGPSRLTSSDNSFDLIVKKIQKLNMDMRDPETGEVSSNVETQTSPAPISGPASAEHAHAATPQKEVLQKFDCLLPVATTRYPTIAPLKGYPLARLNITYPRWFTQEDFDALIDRRAVLEAEAGGPPFVVSPFDWLKQKLAELPKTRPAEPMDESAHPTKRRKQSPPSRPTAGPPVPPRSRATPQNPYAQAKPKDLPPIVPVSPTEAVFLLEHGWTARQSAGVVEGCEAAPLPDYYDDGGSRVNVQPRFAINDYRKRLLAEKKVKAAASKVAGRKATRKTSK